MQIVTIPLTDIDVGKRLRPVDPDHAAFIAESMKERGQTTPIEVRAHPIAGASYGYKLVSGGHRFRACEIAGIEDIEAIVVAATEDQALLMELEENLIRHELNPLDRAVFLAEWQAVYVKLHPEAKRGGDRKSKAKNQTGTVPVRSGSFTDAARERIGLSESTVQRAVKLALSLPPDVRAGLAGSDISRSRKELMDFAAEPVEIQRGIIKQLRARGGFGTVADLARVVKGVAAPAPDIDPEKWLKALLVAWKKASKRERDAFLAAAQGGDQ